MISATIHAALHALRETWIYIIFLYIAFQIVYRQWFAPLHDIPGPWLARHTRLWKLCSYATGRYNNIARELHAKYGPLVRIAPGDFSATGVDALRTIYSAGSGFTKVQLGSSFASSIRILMTIRSQTGTALHRPQIRALLLYLPSVTKNGMELFDENTRMLFQ